MYYLIMLLLLILCIISLYAVHGNDDHHINGNHHHYHRHLNNDNDSNCSSIPYLVSSNKHMNKITNITLLLTSDRHGHVNTLPKLKRIYDHYKKTSGSTFLVDAGDISIGAQFAYYYGASKILEGMNMVGYNVMTIGNHDLEYKNDLLSHQYNFTMISVNVNDFPKSTIISNNGITIGFIGYTITNGLDNSNDRGNTNTIIKLIINEAKVLRPHVDLVILLGHGGIDLDKYISHHVRGHIDIMLGGHSHILRSCEGQWHKDNAIIHAGSNGAHLGILTLQIVTTTSYYISSNNININEYNIEPDEAINKWLSPLLDNIKGSSSLLFDFTDSSSSSSSSSSILNNNNNCRFMVCSTGIIIASAVQWYYNDTCYSFIESGSIRSSFHQRPFYTNDLLEMLPWDNKMVMMTISGNDLMNVLRHSQYGGINGNGSYLQSSIAVLYDNDDNDGNSSSSSSSSSIYMRNVYNSISSNSSNTISNNTKIEGDRTYNIVVTDWLESGGDGYDVLNPQSFASSVSLVSRSSITLREMVKLYLEESNKRKTGLLWNLSALPTTSSSAAAAATVSTSTSSSTSIITQSSSSTTIATATVSPIWYVSILYGLIGVGAEIVSLTVIYPLVTLVSRQQADSNDKGRLYDGIMLTMVARLSSTVLYWYFYYFAIEILKLYYVYIFEGVTHANVNECLTCTGTIAFGSSTFAGVINVVVTNPLWVTTTYLQVHGRYPETLKQLCDGLGINILLIAYPSIRQLFQESLIHIVRIYYHEYHKTAIVYGCMGILSNLVATLITYPIQTMRTRIQARVDSRSLPSLSTSSTSLIYLCRLYYKGFYYKIWSVILYGFIFYYMQKVLSNKFGI